MASDSSRLWVLGLKLDSLVARKNFFTRVALQGDTRGTLGHTLHICRGCIEVIHAVGNGVVYQFVDGFLVYLIPVSVSLRFRVGQRIQP